MTTAHRLRREIDLSPGVVEELAAIWDENGVVSVYLDRGLGSGARRHKPTGLTAALRALEKLDTPVQPTDWTQHRDAIGRRLAELAESERAARGLALFVSLGHGDETILRSPLGFPTDASIGPRASLRPVLGAADAAKPTGVLLIVGDDAVVFELAAGSLREISRVHLGEKRSDWRRATGGHGPSASSGTHSEAQHDRFERRLGAHRSRFAMDVAERLISTGTRRGWRSVIVGGDHQGASAGADRLASAPFAVVRSAIVASPGLSAHAVAELFTEDAGAVQSGHERRIATEIRDGAATHLGRAVMGLDETLSVLQEGRVRILAIDPKRTATGSQAPDGRAVRTGEVIPGVISGRIAWVPDLYDWAIHAAVRINAEVVPVMGRAADELGNDGIGALLRW
jgi:Bacterial archaeo-eukaryotic release factor family 10